MKSKLLNLLIGLAMVFVIGYSVVYEGFWVWVIENTEVPAGKILILVAKTGKQMPSGQIIAEPGQKGVLLEPLGPGRHFINPIMYERQIKDELVIKGGSVGVVIARFGKELPSGEFLGGRLCAGIGAAVREEDDVNHWPPPPAARPRSPRLPPGQARSRRRR